jgi:hypothetical protein
VSARSEITLLATAWGASMLALRAPGVPFGAGFLVATVLALAALALGLRRGSLSLRASLATPHAPFLVALVLVPAALAAASVAPPDSWRAVLRVAIVALTALLARAHAGPALRAALARAGLVVLALLGLALVLGLVSPPIGALVFARSPHQHVGMLPRFAAFTDLPATTGLWALVALGAARWSSDVALRRGATVAGGLVALATLSSATLAVPALLASGLVRHARLRATLVLAACALAAAALFTHPLVLRVGERELALSALHDHYDVDGLGPRHHPVHTSTLGPLSLEWHATAYALLARRAVTCALEHPLLGVGPDRFAERCRVTTMSTYGVWSDARAPHDQLGAWLAELGLVGALVLALSLAVLVRRSPPSTWPLDGWQQGVLAAIAVASLGGEIVETIPVLVFLAVATSPDVSAPRSGEDPSARSRADDARSDAT